MPSHSTGDGSIPPRQTGAKQLRRIMTVGGSYGTRNYTVKDLRELKGKKTLVETVCFTPDEAAAAEEAGVDTMKVRFDPANPGPATAVREAAPHTFMAFSVPLVAAANETEAVRLAYEASKIGADAVMTQWSPKLIAAVTEAGVPVQAHAGLVPRRSTWTGGLRAVGKTLEEAMWIYQQIKSFEKAGAYAVEVEVIPQELLRELTKRTTLLTSSIGAGSGGDFQFLFAEDILGNNPPPYPRHSKQYRELYKIKEKMQRERVDGFKEFIADVQNGHFPEDHHTIQAPSGLMEQFKKAVSSENNK